MDEKKVRGAIEWVKSERIIYKHSIYVSPLIPKEQINLNEEYYNLAIEALEKQLPKKPVLKRNAYGGISVCPICGASDYGKYCRQCGQRINWEEEENERIREDFRSVRKKSKFQKNASKT